MRGFCLTDIKGQVFGRLSDQGSSLTPNSLLRGELGVYARHRFEPAACYAVVSTAAAIQSHAARRA